MITTICFLAFALMSGYFEAYFWNARPRVRQFHTHMMLTWLRFIVILPVLVNVGFWAFACCVLMFPFLHDGMYYRTRNKINSNIYPRGWWDTSYTTGAIISFNAFERTAFAIIGLVTYVITNIIK